MRQVVIPEKVQQSHIVQLLRGLGGQVYELGTRRARGDYQGTRQTPGLPDVLAFLPPSPRLSDPLRIPRPYAQLLMVEAKREGGKVRPAQREFQDWCGRSGIHHVLGTYDAVVGWCIQHGYLKPESVPHYRLLKEGP